MEDFISFARFGRIGKFSSDIGRFYKLCKIWSDWDIFIRFGRFCKICFLLKFVCWEDIIAKAHLALFNIFTHPNEHACQYACHHAMRCVDLSKETFMGLRQFWFECFSIYKYDKEDIHVMISRKNTCILWFSSSTNIYHL